MSDVDSGDDSGDGLVTRWVIEAAIDHLEEARRFAAIDPNAVALLPDGRGRRWEQEGRLVFPSFFCESSALWLKALSYLVLRNRPFRIIMEDVERAENGEEVVRGVARLYPKIEGEMLELLRVFSRADADRLEALSDRIGTAFRGLREASRLEDF